MTTSSNLALTMPEEMLARDVGDVPSADELERAGLFEGDELVKWFGIDYVGTVADYFDPDPNLMRGDGLRQVWAPGALEKIRRAKIRR